MRRLAILMIIVSGAFASLNFADTRAVETASAAAPPPPPAGTEQAESDESFWVGEYAYGEDGGKTAGGTVIFIAHSLGIRREAGALVAEIMSQGYQTSKHVMGLVKVTGNTARIYFKSYGEENLFKPYKAGDLLLTLKRVVQRGRAQILTYWNAYQPSGNPLRNGRVYFKRERT